MSKALFAPQAEALGKAGIPFINSQAPDTPDGGLAAVIDDDLTQTGTIQALAVLAEKGSDANVAFVISPEYAITQTQLDGFKETYTKLCPKCGFDEFPISAADVANGKSTTNMIGYLRANPDVNYLSLGYDPIVGALPPALKSAGLEGKVSVVGNAPTPQQFKYIEDGTVWKSSVMAPMIEEGWHSIDALARALAGDDVKVSSDVEIQRLLVTKQTIPDGALDGFVSYVPDYQEQFKKLWLVG
jgi:ABC-type sugar transport system substrate-binding protein